MVLSLSFPKKLLKRTGKSCFGSEDHHDDDLSATSSTITATLDDDSSTDAATGHSPNSSWRESSTSTVGNRGVRFATHRNVEYENDLMIKCELKELWYQATDYQSFRTLAYDTSQQIIATEKRNRAPHSYQRVMERTFAACSNGVTFLDQHLRNPNDADDRVEADDATDGTDDMESDMLPPPPPPHDTSDRTTNSVLTAENFVHLQRWLEVGSSRIGLEKWSIRAIASGRTSRRDLIVETILQVQRQQTYDQLSGKGSTTDMVAEGGGWDDATAELIRRASEQYSRPSCLFSLVMAQGLAAAIAKENHHCAC
jgi:hypothetical protein